MLICAGMGISRVATLSETDWYGTTVVNTFAERFVALGGQVSTTLTLPKVTTDYSDVVARIKDSRAQAAWRALLRSRPTTPPLP